ncbi:GNAT family N-acetyltransferase [Embleya sp. MST-111070]|uniref:GNAT family N-acetyltransferase n=1 Tax=Embleya sp. MST-111070 TaxID=3398231 RepID=UPI003F741043
MTSILVRDTTRADVDVITALVDEIEDHYGGTAADCAPERTERLCALLFGDHPVGFVMLAIHDGDVAGMASYSFLWPAAGDTSSLYLKELYVRAGHRRRGVARALMSRIEEVARHRGCSRVEWTTERDNIAARAFYASLDAAQLPDKVLYRRDIDATSTRGIEGDR